MTLFPIELHYSHWYMQDLQGQLVSAGMQIKEYEQMHALRGQLQATITSLHSENRVLMENRDKMQSVATEALRMLKTQREQAVDTVQGLKLKHAEELQV